MIEAFWYPDTRLLLPAQSPVAVGRAATGASSTVQHKTRIATGPNSDAKQWASLYRQHQTWFEAYLTPDAVGDEAPPMLHAR